MLFDSTEESAQELILDLVLKRGCKVTFLPLSITPSLLGFSIEYQDKHITRAIETDCRDKEAAKRAASTSIRWAAEELLGKDYRKMVHRNFEEEG